ncbi:KilA-N domain-containing protein (plasmid) [Azospirillum sp. A26]|uniref:KilA-N domain-containing protein n=1 Tax=Azospirillum sp. A26 TaxID=3160607 RepID=UPI00366AD275
MTDLVHPSGAVVHMTGERLNLTDMWKAAGADPQKQPAKWRDLPSTQEFVAHVAEVILGKSENDAFQSFRGGKNPRTEAHWQIGLAYAKYLSPAFHAWANAVVRERMESRPAAPAIDQRVLGGIVKSVVRSQIKEFLTELAPQIIAAQLAADPRVAVIDAVPALQIAIEASVPKKGRRPIVRAISNSLARHCAERGHIVRRDVRGTKIYPLAAVHEWRLSGGDAEIRKLVSANTSAGPLFDVIPGGKPA